MRAGVDWLTPDWPAPVAVRALSTRRGGGTSGGPYASLNLGDHVGDDPEAVTENRRLLGTAGGLTGAPAWLRQVHGTRVRDLDAATGTDAGDAGDAADAAITRHPGRICAVLTADCLPVLLAADSGAAVGAAHAGWRGLAGGVIEATVQALAVPPRRLLAWLGPAIGPDRFEVGPEVRDALLLSDPDATAAFVANARGRFLADLYALARSRLRRLGIERVYGGGECTHRQEDQYFSHRRDGLTGRQASLIWFESPSDG